MRYIDKSECCKEFDVYVRTAKPQEWNQEWNNVETDIKLILHKHLRREQKGLCIYCEQSLPIKQDAEYSAHIRSHIEHIRPRTEYKHLMFDYCNLSISCEGFDCEIEKSSKQPKKEFCEHRKDHQYDEEKFLNPVEIKDIEDYFIYDDSDCKISPNPKRNKEDQEKAKYTIEVLYLNHSSLLKMRQNIYKDKLREAYNGKKKPLSLPYEDHSKILPPFYSMLLHLKVIKQAVLG